MRTLTFLPDDYRYRLLHRATLHSRLPLTTAQLLRAAATVQERIESVGLPMDPTAPLPSGVVAFYHCPHGAVVKFEEAEFAVLLQLIQHTTFPAAEARFAAQLHALLEDAQPETPS